jgi:hypothetical protein
MRKPLYIATTIVFLSIVVFPQTALADDNSDDDSGWRHIFDSGNQHQGDLTVIQPAKPAYDPNHRHKKLENQYGEVDHVGVPSIVIKPGVQLDPGSYQLPVQVTPTPGVSSLGEVEDTTSSSATTEEVQEYISTSLGITFVSANEKQMLTPSKINPAKSAPIQIRDLVLTKKTPADEFLDGAFIFATGLGILALGLLGITGFSAIRLRREAKEL